MNTPARQPPRFVPTLTDIVDPLEVNLAKPKPDAAVEALVKEVWQQIHPRVIQRLQEESERWLRDMLAQHLHHISVRVHSDLESLVRQAVLDALKTQNRAEPDAAPGKI